MALTITSRGSGNHNTGAASFTLSAGSNCTAGATLVLCVAADNSSSGGSSNDFTTVTDTLGNTWTKRQSPVFDNGAASAGVQGAIYTTYQNAGAVQTGTTITVSFGSSPVAKTWTLTEVSAAAGAQAQFRTGGDKSAGATGTVLAMGASATVNVGEVLVAAFFLESGTTQSANTPDADNTNGSWTTNQYNEIGSTTSGSGIISQAKLQTTANSTQSYDVTVGISSDYHGSYVILTETFLPQDITPTVATASATAVTPTVTLGALSVTTAAATASATGVAPSTSFGAIGVTPTVATSSAVAASPTATNAVTVNPTVAMATALGVSPTVTFGAVGSTPTVAIGSAAVVTPQIDLGGITATPTVAISTATAGVLGIGLGALDATPVSAAATALAADPLISVGVLDVSPGAAIAAASAVAPQVSLGGLDVAPTAAVLVAAAPDPEVALGELVATPTAAASSAVAADPTVEAADNSTIVTPDTATSGAYGADPAVTFGPLAVTPAVAIAVAAVGGATAYVPELVALFGTLSGDVSLVGSLASIDLTAELSDPLALRGALS